MNVVSAPSPSEQRHRVVILGGGFAGLALARGLRRESRCDVTVVDRRNFHLFQPLLYQVATGGLSPGDITMPIRSVLKGNPRARVLMGEAVALAPGERRVRLADGEEVPYDTLVVATGVRHHYFGHPEWEARAPGLKTVEDATEIRSRILTAFERAERTGDLRERERLLTFVVVGAGPTGVELAGAVGELAEHTLRREFRRFDPASTRILLVEGRDRVLPPYPEPLSARARAALERLGVEVLTGRVVTSIDSEAVVLQDAAGGEVRVEAATVLWAAGVEASRWAGILERELGAKLDRAGKIEVDGLCSIPGHPEVMVLGDLAHVATPDGPLPGVAPVAMQQGRWAARALRARLSGRQPKPFHYTDKGSLAVIGRAAAVADLGRHLRFSGLLAWLLWLFVHIMYLVGFGNRLVVFVQWAYSYLTRGRGARMIANYRDGEPRAGPGGGRLP